MIPWNGHQPVRTCDKKKTFTGLSRQTEHFRSFKSLYELNAPYFFRKKSVDGSPFLKWNGVCLQVRSNSHGFLHYFNKEFRKVDLNRNRGNILASKDMTVLPQIAAKHLATKKYEHLQNLLKWVPKFFSILWKPPTFRFCIDD